MKKIILLLILILPFLAFAEIPRVINYQGKLTDQNNNPLPEGIYKLTFRLYDASESLLWTEVHGQVMVSGGIFNVLLGTIEPLGLTFDAPYYLGIQLDNQTEFRPFVMLTSTPYSLKSGDAATISGIEVSKIPQPNTILPLNEKGKFPASVLPDVSNYNVRVIDADGRRVMNEIVVDDEDGIYPDTKNDPMAIEVEGDLIVSGAYRGNYGPNGGAPFPRPAFDSGWHTIGKGETLKFLHRLGYNADNYFVDVRFKDMYGNLNHLGFGGYDKLSTAWWNALNSSEICISRSTEDEIVREVRVCIWIFK